MSAFRPLCINALYTGIERGLAADLRATHLLDGQAHAVCTSLITASHGQVTDVLPVPSDSVQAQLEHLFGAVPSAEQPTAVRIGIVSQSATIAGVFEALRAVDVPLVLDLTLSGPSGEDIINASGLDLLKEHLSEADVVTLRRQDAELVASMEIGSLDDAQVAVQRLHRLGASNVLLRCGVLPARHFEDSEATETDKDFYADLFYDGEEFHLFEAPHLRRVAHGASSMLTLALARTLQSGAPLIEALQRAKRFTTDRLRDELDHAPVENTQSL